MNIIGKNIKKLRLVKKMSQSAFAKHFGLSRASIGSYEEGRAEPKLDTLFNIASEFNLSLDALVSRELTTNEALGIRIDLLENSGLSRKGPRSEYRQDVALYDQSSVLRLKGTGLSEPASYLRLPNPGSNQRIAWALSGFEMIDKKSNLQQGDVLIFEETPKKAIGKKSLVLILNDQDAPVFGRIANESLSELQFDNPNTPNLPIDSKNNKLYWALHAVYSSSLVL